MIASLRYWLMRHPHLARPMQVLGGVQLLACAAVGTAPAATASTNAVVLNWTGLHDNYGVPVGDLFLSLASARDQLLQTGPDASVIEPGTWLPWLVHAMTVMFDSFTAANILTAEAGMFVGIVALAIWVMRVTISSYWLTVLGELARAITTAVIEVTTRWGLVALTVPIGVFLGVLAVRRGERGRGATMILLALFMPALAVTVFTDPAGLMYGPTGLLQFGRRMAFSTAQAATHGGAVTAGGFTAQVDTLTSSLITHIVREPLEVFNFGHVVDRIGGCGTAVSAAWMQGVKDAPIKALARCGDHAGVSYAQHLDASNVVGGAILVTAALLFGWFMVSAGASVFMVSVKAIYTTAKLLPSVFVGGIDGAAREHAKSTVWKYFKHPLEAMVYITFVSVIGLAIERLLARPLPAELGGDNPFAHVLMMGGASMVALHLLRHIRADLEGSHPGRGVWGRAGDVALGLGMHAALGGAGKAALGGARGLRGALSGGAGKTPWEQLDEKAGADSQQVLGPAQEGFDPVPPVYGSGHGAEAGAMPALDTAGEPGGGRPAIEPVGSHSGELPALTRRNRQRQGRSRPNSRTTPRQTPLRPGVATEAAPTPLIDPVGAHGPRETSWDAGVPPLSSDVDPREDIPPPWDAPPDLGRSLSAHPDDLRPPAATVDPITDDHRHDPPQ